MTDAEAALDRMQDCFPDHFQKWRNGRARAEHSWHFGPYMVELWLRPNRCGSDAIVELRVNEDMCVRIMRIVANYDYQDTNNRVHFTNVWWVETPIEKNLTRMWLYT